MKSSDRHQFPGSDDTGSGSGDSGPGSGDSGPGSDDTGPGSDDSGPGDDDFGRRRFFDFRPDLGRDIGTARWWRHLAGLAGLIGLVFALGVVGSLPTPRVAPGPETAPAPSLASKSLEPPVPTLLPEPLGPPPPPVETVTAAIGRGDTLMEKILVAGASNGEAFAAVSAMARVYDPRRLRGGQRLTLTFIPAAGGGRELQSVSLTIAVDRSVTAVRQREGVFKASEKRLALAMKPVFAAGKISDSLFLSAQRVHVPAAVIVELIRIFSFDVDFQREIRAGDGFEIYYQRFTDRDGLVTKHGDILYAGLTLRGKSIRLFRYTPADDQRSDYFDAAGRSARKSLMRTPVDGARLTSRYGLRRHPILGYSRMHRGLDFGAPRGTPVMAAGDGVIERASRYGSYGRYVRIRHNGEYSTAYAHLNGYGRGIRRGRRVKQGQTIGYVGSTGGATGPHLHYEVLLRGKQVNPLTLKLPTGRRLKGAELVAFQAAAGKLAADVTEIAAGNLARAGRCPRGGGPDPICDSPWHARMAGGDLGPAVQGPPPPPRHPGLAQ